MKALAEKPMNGNLLKLIRGRVPALVPVAESTYMRPIEIRRYVRNLRETRRYHFTRDFLY
jgi:hypothetical protein